MRIIFFATSHPEAIDIFPASITFAFDKATVHPQLSSQSVKIHKTDISFSKLPNIITNLAVPC